MCDKSMFSSRLSRYISHHLLYESINFFSNRPAWQTVMLSLIECYLGCVFISRDRVEIMCFSVWLKDIMLCVYVTSLSSLLLIFYECCVCQIKQSKKLRKMLSFRLKSSNAVCWLLLKYKGSNSFNQSVLCFVQATEDTEN